MRLLNHVRHDAELISKAFVSFSQVFFPFPLLDEE